MRSIFRIYSLNCYTTLLVKIILFKQQKYMANWVIRTQIIHSSIHSFFILSFAHSFIYLINVYVLATICQALPQALGTHQQRKQNIQLRSMHKFQKLDVHAVFAWCHLADLLMKVNVTSQFNIKQQKLICLSEQERRLQPRLYYTQWMEGVHSPGPWQWTVIQYRKHLSSVRQVPRSVVSFPLDQATTLLSVQQKERCIFPLYLYYL